MLKIGHRGAAAYIAENTLESVQKAMDFGVDGVEVDVHLCASGELVVFHDITLDRMTTGSGEIGEWTLDELKVLRVQQRHRIPTLKDILNIIDKKCLINIELKGLHTAAKTCEIILHYIKNHGWNYADFIVSSFQENELKKVYEIDKNIRLGVLTKASVEEAIEIADKIQAFSIHPNYALLSSRNVKIAQSRGYKVIVWTVNLKDTIKRMKKFEVDGIISDKPDRL